ncbi:GNAT family N-acetyltransferase [Salipaludibacillus neizhouensis]|uniref:GNAT family N-acetyltransferase n=1 Tax=Salipaludibacillus neizhouensis TaxID=885475 RepID=A0A3A9K3X4_9BACI|nr:GNAT family N-acetyltransferase [Salipaludibacillus neizhouensis]RKL65182.1 GNAT family N-acetyltransferase [Salipaludibacillus neizhouensis]
MIEIIAYEMEYVGGKVESKLSLTPYSDEFHDSYQKIYNECFYEMRKVLGVKPYNFYSSKEQIADKKNNIYLLIQNEKLIASVACYDNEIDDLIVNKKFQGQGYGTQLLFWAINHIQNNSNELPIKLHVAKWNENAVSLYKENNFKCTKVEKKR